MAGITETDVSAVRLLEAHVHELDCAAIHEGADSVEVVPENLWGAYKHKSAQACRQPSERTNENRQRRTIRPLGDVEGRRRPCGGTAPGTDPLAIGGGPARTRANRARAVLAQRR